MTYRKLEGRRTIIERGSDAYPPGLLEVEDPPRQLYVLGNPEALLRPSIAIIGARKATPYGLACARMAATCAADLRIQVVSGAAIGCDQTAQREAVDGGVSSVAVLGGGADVVYPASSAGLLEDILTRDGAVVSLQPWGAPPVGWSFVRRNPVIAGLARALVICEAGMPSGTFSTAEAAEAAGREVLVFPGSVFSPNSRGSNYLLGQSSTFMPVWDRACLEVALGRTFGRLVSPRSQTGPGYAGAGTGEVGERLLRILEASPELPGALARSARLSAGELMRHLGELEVLGLVRRLADGRYSPTEAYFLHRVS